MPIHQEVTINALPADVYDALLDSETFTRMTGGRDARISPEIGGEAALFDGAIQARNLELVPGTRVVQSWRAGNWPDGVHSVVRFELVEDGGKTKLVFDQTGYPDDAESHLADGWHKMYWAPMNALFDQP